MALMRQAGSEAFTPNPQRPPQTLFVRRLVIDAHCYLSDALPQDLTPDEVRSIQGRLPPEVRAPEFQIIPATRVTEDPPAHPSFLHRSVATITMYLILIFGILAPLIKLLIGVLYDLERNHQVSEKVGAIGIVVSSAMWRAVCKFMFRLMELADGKVGLALQTKTIWAANEIAGGTIDGTGRALVRLRVTEQEAEGRRRRPDSAHF
jgi:hypothetical protein